MKSITNLDLNNGRDAYGLLVNISGGVIILVLGVFIIFKARFSVEY